MKITWGRSVVTLAVLHIALFASLASSQTLNDAVTNQLDFGALLATPCFELLDEGTLPPEDVLTGALLGICQRTAPSPGAGPSTSTGGGATTPTTLPSIVQQRLREARGEEKMLETKMPAASADAVAKLGGKLNIFYSGEHKHLNRDVTTVLMGQQPDYLAPLQPLVVMGMNSDATNQKLVTTKIAMGPIRVTGVKIQEATANSAIIRIQADQPVVNFSTFMPSDQPRIVIDIAGALLAEPMLREQAGKGPIKQIRSSQYRREPRPLVRVVLDLASSLPYRVAGLPDTFRLMIGETVTKADQVRPLVPSPVTTERQKPGTEELLLSTVQEQPFRRSLSLWGAGEYENLDRDVTRFEDGYDSDIWRMTVGVDYPFTDRIVGGLAFDYYHHDGDFKSGGGFDVDSYGILGFTNFLPVDDLFIQVFGGWARINYDRSRVAAFADRRSTTGKIVPVVPPSSIQGDYNADEVHINALTAYDYFIGNVTISPRAGIDYRYIDFDTYSETGGTGLELTFHGDDQKWLKTRVGVQTLVAFSTDFGLIMPQASLDWMHEFENDQRDVEVSFVDDTRSKRFAYQTESPDRNWFELNTGVVLAIVPAGVQVFGNYRTLLGHKYFDSHAVTIGIHISF